MAWNPLTLCSILTPSDFHALLTLRKVFFMSLSFGLGRSVKRALSGRVSHLLCRDRPGYLKATLPERC